MFNSLKWKGGIAYGRSKYHRIRAQLFFFWGKSSAFFRCKRTWLGNRGVFCSAVRPCLFGLSRQESRGPIPWCDPGPPAGCWSYRDWLMGPTHGRRFSFFSSSVALSSYSVGRIIHPNPARPFVLRMKLFLVAAGMDPRYNCACEDEHKQTGSLTLCPSIRCVFPFHSVS